MIDIVKFFNKTSIGKKHIVENIKCQDYSDSYQSFDRTIVTACDGHGGNLYIRSDKGSKFASEAVVNVLSSFKWMTFYHNDRIELTNQIRIQILCEWNKLVEEDLADHPIDESEMEKLNHVERLRLINNPVKAYGTTVGGAMIIKNKIICVSLGDGGCFLLEKGKIYPAFEEDDSQVANITNSLCQRDAFDALHVGVFDGNKFDGVLICSDGVINPYGSIANFEKYLAIPATNKVLLNKNDELSDFITDLGAEKGIGDDVSLSIVINKRDNIKYYM